MRQRIENGNDNCVLLIDCSYEGFFCDCAVSIIELEVFEINDIAVAKRIS
jgi:hypothetical protein